jgi:hypothetical protein
MNYNQFPHMTRLKQNVRTTRFKHVPYLHSRFDVAHRMQEKGLAICGNVRAIYNVRDMQSQFHTPVCAFTVTTFLELRSTISSMY